MKIFLKCCKVIGIVILAAAAGGYTGWFFDRKSAGIGTAGAILTTAYLNGKRKKGQAYK